jgi:uncharacterized protein YaiI (UPF0178 family)
VDADACPGAIKDILYRAAERVGVRLTLVANRPLSVPRSRFIETRQVGHGFDVADRWIVDQVAPGDLVVTADVPLAADVVERGGVALDPRGELLTEDNVRERLAMRDLLAGLRDAGMVSGGPAPLGKSERRAFAAALDRFLARA